MLSPEAMRRLGAAGLTVEQIAIVAEVMHAEKAEKRAKDAERKRRQRECHAMSRDVTRTECDIRGHDVTPPVPPFPSPEPLTPNPPISPQTTPKGARERQIQIPPDDGMWSRAHYDAFDAEVFEACGAAARRPGGSLDNTAPLRALLDQGCDFREDIVGTIRAKCQAMAPGSLRSWGFLGEAIIEARDRRRRMSSMAQEGRPPSQPSRQKPIDWNRVLQLSEAR